MHAVADIDRDYAGRTSGDLALALELPGRLEAAALKERPVLVTEAGGAIGANPVGELHPPAAPRRDAFDERIAVIARMPRAATEEHRDLPTFSPCQCNGYASRDCHHDDADLTLTWPVERENLFTVPRARVEKFLGRRAPQSGVGRTRPAWCGHNRS